MLKCARDTEAQNCCIKMSKGQNIALGTRMDGQIPILKKKTRRLFVTLEICNFAEIWGLGKGNIGQVPLTRWLGGASMGGVTLGGASVGRVTQGPRPASMKGKIPIWGEQTFIHIPWDGVTQHAMF